MKLPVISFTSPWSFLRALAGALAGLVLLGFIAAFCAGRASMHERQHEQQTAERDSSRARGARERRDAQGLHVAHNAERHRLDSLATVFRLADSLAADAAARLARKLPIDTNDIVAVRAENRELRAIVAQQAAALADARLMAPAAFVTIDTEERATTLALASADHFARADTLSQALGEDAEKAAHRRGIVQGIKGTVTGLAVVAVVGAVLHLVGKL